MSEKQGSEDRRELLKAAFVRIQQLEAQLSAAAARADEPIAIVGLSCRFPAGANDPEAFWELLRAGRDGIVEVPSDRWNIDDHFDVNPDAPGKTYSRFGGFLDQVDRFDADFFGIAPREAALMDPQQRLLLEVSWEALERGGIAPATLKGTATGVFVGLTATDYAHLIAREGIDAIADAYLGSGIAPSVAGGRLSYTLGLQGPCLTVDTACSSSLVAVHLACLSLRAGECQMALAGGVSLILGPDGHILASKGRMLSPDGRCFTFDARANGYVRSEGCGIVVLKRLSDARADGDRVLAIISGTALNQDGRSSGLTAPNGRAQEDVMRRALAAAGARPSDITYVEAHGTGTSLGDPIEVDALAAVHQERPLDKPILIGSVKSNIGHLEAAAGIAALIKVVLSLQHGALPGHLHFQEPNPYIPWERVPVKVTTSLTPWVAHGQRRLAGVSSFGFSGTNAHLVIEGADTPSSLVGTAHLPERTACVLPLSAKSEHALKAMAEASADVLRSDGAPSLGDFCFTAGVGRSHHEMRLGVVAADAATMAARLDAFVRGDADSHVMAGSPIRRAVQPVFVFGGQGSQYVAMARRLFESEPTFREVLLRCDEILRPLLPRPLMDVLYPVKADSQADALLRRTEYTQPALFAVEYALAELWKSWGVVPSAVIGHSIGEYAAACVAGVFTMEDGLRLIAERGRLMQSLPDNGAMVAVMAGPDRVASFLKDADASVAIAAVNAAQSVVISGSHAGIADCVARLVAANVATRQLDVSHAFHSPLVEPILAALEAAAAGVRMSAPRIEIISNVSGDAFNEAEPIAPSYWPTHARRPVLFAAGVDTLRHGSHSLFLEIAPRDSLSRLGRTSSPKGSNEIWLPSIDRDGDGDLSFSTVAALYTRGVRIDWAAFDRGRSRTKVAVPTYRFQRERFWFSTSVKRSSPLLRKTPKGGHTLLGERLRSPRLQDIVFESHLDAVEPAYLQEHRIAGRTIVPASAYLEIASAAAVRNWGPGSHEVRALDIREAMRLDDGPRVVQTMLATGETECTLEICSAPAEGDSAEWVTHATGVLRRGREPYDAQPVTVVPVPDEQDPASYYAKLSAAGAEYGPSFRLLKRINSGVGVAVGEIATDGVAVEAVLHPTILDAAFQLAGVALATLPASDGALYVPIHIEEFRTARPPSGPLEVIVTVRDAIRVSGATFTCDLALKDVDGMMGHVSGLTFRRIRAATDSPNVRADVKNAILKLEWIAQEPPADPTPDRSVADGTWLIFDDESNDGLADLAGYLGTGNPVVHVRRGDAYVPPRQGVAIVREDSPGDFVSLLNDIGTPVVSAVLHLWNLVASPSSQSWCVDLLHLTQALVDRDTPLPRFTIVTRGAQAVSGVETRVDVRQAAAWGFVRTLALEEPALIATILDLDPAEALAAQIGNAIDIARAAEPRESQIGLRAGQRYVPRLVRWSEPARDRGRLTVPAGRRFALDIRERGVIDNLELQSFEPGPPAAGEVQIETIATGMNFRDALNALGMYPGDPGPLGNECVGRITALGEGVADFAVGDVVMALTPRAFCSSVNTMSALAHRLPQGMDVLDAATIPLAYQTAYYALVHIGGLKRGNRVLIHAAAGGVGLAAVQIAQSIGAEIFATAGSHAKRSFLSRMGVPHVMSSRTLDFREEVMRATNGEGVDVVLNSLAADFIPATLDLVADNGCFLELGKSEIWSAEEVRRHRASVRYEPVFLGEVCIKSPERIQAIYRDLVSGLEAGTLRPLPRVIFPIDRATDAFRFMAQARHTGKIVVTSRVPDRTGALDPAGTYLISGGMGALGLHTARWMADRGARRIVLLGRNAPSPDSTDAIAALQADGVDVIVSATDVSNRASLANALATYCGETAPLRGVVHAAGCVDDGSIRRQTSERFARVFAPKTGGALNLDALTRGADLDFFVLFSAGAAVLGSPGQAGYAAANASLDALAADRRAAGLPASSINWGPWSGGGMAARVSQRDRDRWGTLGIRMIDRDFGIAALDAVLAKDLVQASVLPLDWSRMTSVPPILRSAAPARKTETADKEAQRDLSAGLLASLTAADEDDRAVLLRACVRDQVSRVLGSNSLQKRDDDRGLTELGLDSLMAVELSNRLGATVGRKLAATIAFDYPTVLALAEHLGGLLDLQQHQATQDPAPAAELTPSVDEFEGLSDDALERSLAEELDRAGY